MPTTASDPIALQAAKALSRRAALLTLGGAALAPRASVSKAKKRKKKKCKKPKPVRLQTELVSCPGPVTGLGRGGRRLAQTFAAARTGVLTTALVEASSVLAGTDFIIEIRGVDSAGVPTDEIHASADVNDVPATVLPSTRPLAALFDPPASVVKGDVYALVVTETPGSSNYELLVSAAASFDGEFFFDDLADGNFTPVVGVDMIFTVSITFAA